MATVRSVKEIQNSNLLRIGVNDGEESLAYTLRENIYREIGSPIRGFELSDGEMEMIKREDEFIRAKKSALSLLSYADNNERTLQSKLRKKGYSSEIAAEVAKDMVCMGYINEESQIERLILSEANFRLRGAGKIIPKLVAKGYSAQDVRRVLSELCERGEIDFEKNASLLIKKKLSEEADREAKVALLLKNGFRVRGIE